MLQHILSVVTILLAFHTDSIVSEQVCGNPVVWRNNNITCPSRAVCADVFDSQRDWLNGTTCLERRVLSNCLCAGNEVCPFNDPHHRLYASPTQSMYICEPVCLLSYCPNVQQSMNPLGSNRRGSRTRDSNRVVALTTEQRAEEFSRRNYNRMSCRCPRHHYPDTHSRRGRNRSVKAFRYQYNYALRRYSTQYICNIGSSDEVRQDPCPPRTQ